MLQVKLSVRNICYVLMFKICLTFQIQYKSVLFDKKTYTSYDTA